MILISQIDSKYNSNTLKNHDISIVGSNVEYIDKDSRFINYSDLPLKSYGYKI